MYRFRSVENLIGRFQELEKQQIYFADLDELNDPLEGKRIYFWKGDKIVWENFLKHYLLCLEHVVMLSRLLDENETISKKDIPINISFNDLPTDIYKERIKRIYNKFFTDKFVQAYIQFIIKNHNKMYVNEMYVHLKILSARALKSIFSVDIEDGLLINNNAQELNIEQMNIDFANAWDELDNNEYKKLMEVFREVMEIYDNKLLLKFKDSSKLQSINIEFTQMYLDSVVELTSPKAYVACFMDNCTNSSIWGTYGNNHTGVCLKFKTNENNHMLTLKGISSLSSSKGYSKEYISFKLEKIEYSTEFNEVDFFSNLGCLPMPKLKEQWYTNDNGDVSVCSEKIFKKTDEWRKEYWKNYHDTYLKKLPDWSHEREYRIVLGSSLDFYIECKDRLLEYKFEDLEEIIFGMKTPKEAKIKIIEIIKDKCDKSGRKDFKFYQMDYSPDRKELYKREILSL